MLITGTIRTFEEEAQREIHRLVEEAFALVRHFGGDYELDISTGYPALYNDPGVAELIRGVGTELLGAEKSREGEPIMAGEDFAYMTQEGARRHAAIGGEAGRDQPAASQPDF